MHVVIFNQALEYKTAFYSSFDYYSDSSLNKVIQTTTKCY